MTDFQKKYKSARTQQDLIANNLIPWKLAIEFDSSKRTEVELAIKVLESAGISPFYRVEGQDCASWEIKGMDASIKPTCLVYLHLYIPEDEYRKSLDSWQVRKEEIKEELAQ